MLLQQWMQWAVYWTWFWDINVLADEKRHIVKRLRGVCGWVVGYKGPPPVGSTLSFAQASRVCSGRHAGTSVDRGAWFAGFEWMWGSACAICTQITPLSCILQKREMKEECILPCLGDTWLLI